MKKLINLPKNMTRNKNIYNKVARLISFTIVFLFCGVNFVSAAEVPLPGLTGTTLKDYVIYFFKAGVMAAGAIALISFTVGAVQLIVSGDSTGANSEAKDRMRGAVLGLIITICSYLIIQTINPNIITFPPQQKPPTVGVFLTGGAGGDVQASPAMADTATLPNGASQLKYVCDSNNNDSYILVWTYPQTNFQGNSGNGNDGITITSVGCGGTAATGASYKWAYDIPGVYFCKGGCNGDVCSGDMSEVYNENVDSIEAPFKGNIKGVRIVNDVDNGISYGVILHQAAGLDNGGICSYPIVGDGCMTVDIKNNDISGVKAVAANIFQINQNPTSSGKGVSFYSKAYGWDTGANAGFLNIQNSNIQSLSSSSTAINPSSDMCFNYDNVDVPDAYKFKCSGSSACGGNNGNNNNGGNSDGCLCPDNSTYSPGCCGASYNNNQNTTLALADFQIGGDAISKIKYAYSANQNMFLLAANNGDDDSCSDSACETFQDCPGSIKIDGDYLVALYSASGYCQTFSADVPNLNTQPILAAGGSDLIGVYIIPTSTAGSTSSASGNSTSCISGAACPSGQVCDPATGQCTSSPGPSPIQL